MNARAASHDDNGVAMYYWLACAALLLLHSPQCTRFAFGNKTITKPQASALSLRRSAYCRSRSRAACTRRTRSWSRVTRRVSACTLQHTTKPWSPAARAALSNRHGAEEAAACSAAARHVGWQAGPVVRPTRALLLRTRALTSVLDPLQVGQRERPR